MKIKTIIVICYMDPCFEWLNSVTIADNTKNNYKTSYKKFVTAGLNLEKDSELKIIKASQTFTENVGSQRSILSSAVAFRKYKELPTARIEKHRRGLQRELATTKAKVDEAHVDKREWATPQQLHAHEAALYENGDWRGYIVCSLLRLLHCRNLDLQLFITRDAKLAYGDTKNNYLVLLPRARRCCVLRNRYKTVHKYGPKRNYTASHKLYHAFEQLLLEDCRYWVGQKQEGLNCGWLFPDKHGNPLPDDRLSREVSKHTCNDLTEVDYNKIFVSAIKEVKDFHKLHKIACMRGTTLSSLLDFYHLDMKKSFFQLDNKSWSDPACHNNNISPKLVRGEGVTTSICKGNSNSSATSSTE